MRSSHRRTIAHAIASGAANGGFLSTLLRFLVSGGCNTLATLLLYWLLLTVFSAHVAYGISFLVGVCVSYFINSAFVFGVRPTWRTFLTFPFVYLIGYAAGALVLELAMGWLHVPRSIAPLFSIVVTVPLTFVLLRFAFLRDSRGQA